MSGWRTVTIVAAGLAFAAGPAFAQSPAYPPPPASPEASEIAACLCLQRDVNALGAEMTSRRQAYDASKREVARLDAELQRERGRINVDDPEETARFRQLLARRDAAFRRSSGPDASAATAAVARYNSSIQEYNARCANRPRNSVLLSQVQATLSCPAPR